MGHKGFGLLSLQVQLRTDNKLDFGLIFAVLIIRSLDNHECRKIDSTLRKCGKELGEEHAYQYI